MRERLGKGLVVFIAPFILGALAACDGTDDPVNGGPDGSVVKDSGPDLERPDAGGCVRADTDYEPGADDGWPPCISDDGEYHQIEATVSSIARVKAFEEIAGLLFDPAGATDGDAFLQARLIYQEDEGLDSRVVRRYDPHLQAPVDGDCTVEGIPEDYPDYCVGPATLQPLLLEAFNGGIAGDAPQPNAARIEAGLVWFLYVSVYKESLTCTDTARDCDSAWAYYTGGEPARGGIGLARMVRRVDPLTHDRAWDGLLAVRCWRDLDPAEVATDIERRELARDQTDRALIDGVAAIVRDRLQRLEASDGGERDYHHAFLQVLAPLLDREARSRSASEADVLLEELQKTDPAAVDTVAAIDAIDALFVCP